MAILFPVALVVVIGYIYVADYFIHKEYEKEWNKYNKRKDKTE